ncbi:hypothetical protein C8J57DRAFT_1257023 [Mycena rebaudengoi]|nr:hypothetical protein C8J57DRAFT_1257023 [Mycena rebaudengoi]
MHALWNGCLISITRGNAQGVTIHNDTPAHMEVGKKGETHPHTIYRAAVVPLPAELPAKTPKYGLALSASPAAASSAFPQSCSREYLLLAIPTFAPQTHPRGARSSGIGGVGEVRSSEGYEREERGTNCPAGNGKRRRGIRRATSEEEGRRSGCTLAARTMQTTAIAQAGTVPTNTLLEELMIVSTDNPTMKELNALPYLENVVRETLRVHTPLVSVRRQAPGVR